MSEDIEKIARGLSESRKGLILLLSSEWQPGPAIPDRIIGGISELRLLGLIEREFMDEGPPVATVGRSSYRVRLSACWHFRLTPLGLRVRAHLEGTHP